MFRIASVHLLLSFSLIFAVVSNLSMTAHGAEALTPFESHSDVGPVVQSGSVAFDPARQEFTIAAAGSNMWDDHDECHFVWKRMSGDFLIQADAALVGAGVEPHRKLGLMIRASLDADSAYVDALVHGDGATALQFRRAQGGATEQIQAPITSANVLQLERKGGRFIMRAAWRGEPFASDRAVDLDLGQEVYVGLFVCSHNADVVEQGKFCNVRIVVPAADGFEPYQDYIGSNLEIVDVETGRREIMLHTPDAIQAPNWSSGGNSLLYNSGGHLYRFDLASRQRAKIETGLATRNNNDHVLSFDGAMLGISHHSEQHDGDSMVYVLPAGGGEPRLVTQRGPSYLHGWSPDGSELVYTGERDGQFDIYKISVDGGEERRLTEAEGLDDGPEFSPDGRWIYFNSARSGRMQVWRMTADGFDQQQVTDDEYNNWFPHISPDGKWIAFLSFSPETAPDDHPFYQHVLLRVMPAGGGPARVVAYVYGGQGTINVPSWSPDSKRLAFVSNTAGD